MKIINHNQIFSTFILIWVDNYQQSRLPGSFNVITSSTVVEYYTSLTLIKYDVVFSVEAFLVQFILGFLVK